MIPSLRCPVCGSEKVHTCGTGWVRQRGNGFPARRPLAHPAKVMPKIACDDCRKVYRTDGKGDPQDYWPEEEVHEIPKSEEFEGG